MKAILLLFLMSFGTQQATAQNLGWQWAKTMSGNGDNAATSITTDGTGHVYVTGYYRSSTLNIGNVVLTNSGIGNVFIAKYDEAGNVLWAKNAGGDGDDYSRSIYVDRGGNIYVAGAFNSSSFGYGGSDLINLSYSYDIFVIKYDSLGQMIWGKSAGGDRDDVAYAIHSDVNGDVLVTGSLGSSRMIIANDSLFNGGRASTFIIKYNSSGQEIWGRCAGGTVESIGQSICTDLYGNCYVTGGFSHATITFGNGLGLTNNGQYNVFTVKYDVSGNPLWAKKIGGSGMDQAEGIIADSTGNIYIAGFLGSPLVRVGTDSLQSKGGTDAFIANMMQTEICYGQRVQEAQPMILPPA